YPCVQFPLPTGNVRKQKFIDIWLYSPQFRKCALSAWPIYRDAPNASTPAHARVAPGWLTWKAICAGRRSRIARSPSPEPEFPRKICSRSIPTSSKSPISTRLHFSRLNELWLDARRQPKLSNVERLLV